jgi:hypothetical protein
MNHIIIHALHDLRALSATMKSANEKSVNMNVWDRDIKTVEDAIATIETIRNALSTARDIEREHCAEIAETLSGHDGHRIAEVIRTGKRSAEVPMFNEPSKEELQALHAWMREPDYAENFLLSDVIEWVNRRPTFTTARLAGEPSSSPKGDGK